MLIQKVEYTDTKHVADLLNRLRDRVFHVTTRAAFECIREDGAILHNREERFPVNVASERSFGRIRGWVCLFDLRNHCDETVQKTLRKYNFLEPSWFTRLTADFSESNLAYLFLAKSAYSSLVPNDLARKEEPYGHYVPETEVWFPGNIPIALIEEALLVRIWRKAPKDDDWEYALHMLAVNAEKRREGG